MTVPARLGAMSEDRSISVERDGPYHVEGDLPVHPGAIVETEHGEPVEWDVGEPYGAGSPVKLCRCGRSRTKPFCDDSHLEPRFDGTETADRGPTAERRRAFPGHEVTLTDDGSICSRAGFCRDRRTDVWHRMLESARPEMRERIEGIVARCPSGRLELERDEDGAHVEPELPASIVVERDGPYWVRGGVAVASADGETWEIRNRVTLCRCGASENKPFCDGSHKDIGFRG
jgi:CDGSH-type Zn-finger protein